MNKQTDLSLHDAANRGNVNAAFTALAAGTAVDDRDSYGNTPLWHAAYMGHAQVVRLLLDNGAYVNAPGSNGWTPLHAASVQRHDGVVEMLLDRGADPDALNDANRTPEEAREVILRKINTPEATRPRLVEGSDEWLSALHRGWRYADLHRGFRIWPNRAGRPVIEQYNPRRPCAGGGFQIPWQFHGNFSDHPEWAKITQAAITDWAAA